ncbi:MAG TPA: AMP-binding protein [Streptosporangiaceae bacterium]|jgi:acyl-CoA synthetase (AMP-forming)/AMP-acid ligase II
MALTMPELVSRLASGDTSRLALTADGGAGLTAGDWARRASRIARGLVRRGIRPGDRVALLFHPASWLEYAVAAAGVYLAGGAVVGLQPGLPAAELSRRLARCQVTGLLCGDGVSPPDCAAWTASPGELATAAAGPPEVTARPGALAEILHTSGSTGPAKAVAVSQANLTHGHGRARGQLFAGTAGVLAPVPAGTNAGHSAIILALTAPVTVHLTTATDPAGVAAMIGGLGPGQVILPAQLISRLVASGLHERHDFGAVTAFLLGSAPVRAAAVRALAAAAPRARMLIGYGSTEAAPAFCHTAIGAWAGHQDPAVYDQLAAWPLGLPAAGTEVMIADAAGNRLPPGQRGQICLRSAAPQRRYYRDRAATAAVFRGGWTRMGDLGHQDEDGRLYFFDRAADVLAGPDGTLSSAQAEAMLAAHPAVADAAVVSGPWPGGADGVCAAVQLRSQVPAAQLRGYLAARLGISQHRIQVRIHAALPRGDTGKAAKAALREACGRAGGPDADGSP